MANKKSLLKIDYIKDLQSKEKRFIPCIEELDKIYYQINNVEKEVAHCLNKEFHMKINDKKWKITAALFSISGIAETVNKSRQAVHDAITALTEIGYIRSEIIKNKGVAIAMNTEENKNLDLKKINNLPKTLVIKVGNQPKEGVNKVSNPCKESLQEGANKPYN